MLINRKNVKFGVPFIGWLLCCMVISVVFSCSSKSNGEYQRLQELFDQANVAYHRGELEMAVDSFRLCVRECAKAKYENDDSVKLLLPKAMGQLLNGYQAQGDLGDAWHISIV